MRYRLENYGDKVEFEVLEKLSDNDFRIKDLHTLEVFHFHLTYYLLMLPLLNILL